MKIAVLSDSHDNIWNLERALDQVRQLEAGALLFLGDFCAPFTLKQVAEGFERGPIHAVFGNNDGDPFLLSQIASNFDHFTLHGQFAELEIERRKIAMNHYPDIAKRVAESGAFDAVFSGHDHLKYVHKIGGGIWANPGEVMGRFGEPSFGIYDTESGEFAHIALS